MFSPCLRDVSDVHKITKNLSGVQMPHKYVSSSLSSNNIIVEACALLSSNFLEEGLVLAKILQI